MRKRQPLAENRLARFYKHHIVVLMLTRFVLIIHEEDRI